MPASYSAGQQHLAASGLSARTPPGNPTPSSAVRTVKQFVRDPAVVAHVLHLSGGRCEHCGCEAPFKRADGTPYLEVHHVQTLAESDLAPRKWTPR